MGPAASGQTRPGGSDGGWRSRGTAHEGVCPPSGKAVRRMRLIHRYIVATAIYLLTAAVFTWPAVLHMSTRVIGGGGDTLFHIWAMRWWQHALGTWHNPFITDQ